MQVICSIVIIVPTLNSFKLLSCLVDSLRAQSFTNWRVVFVDGNSNDEHRSWLLHCCQSDSRCSIMLQRPDSPGIFGAMSQAFAAVDARSWLLFWGSDDFAASPEVLAKLVGALNEDQQTSSQPDLVVCRGRYVDGTASVLGRETSFLSSKVRGIFSIPASRYRKLLFLGATPPHQATLFSPRIRQYLGHYSPGFRLSADLDYFLKISSCPDLVVNCLDLELVHMGDGGISGSQTWRRLQEVWRAYQSAFGLLCWLPFLMRYVRRSTRLLTTKYSIR